MVKWVKDKKEKVSPSALSTLLLTFTSLLTRLNSRRKLQRPFLKLEDLLLKWWKQLMSELTLSSINSSGTKVSETCPEESESESQERDPKKKDPTNGTHSFNTSTLNHSPIDSPKRLKSQLDLLCYLKSFHFFFHALTLSKKLRRPKTT